MPSCWTMGILEGDRNEQLCDVDGLLQMLDAVLTAVVAMQGTMRHCILLQNPIPRAAFISGWKLWGNLFGRSREETALQGRS